MNEVRGKIRCLCIHRVPSMTDFTMLQGLYVPRLDSMVYFSGFLVCANIVSEEFHHSFTILKISGTINNEEKSYNKRYLPLSFSKYNETSPKLVYS